MRKSLVLGLLLTLAGVVAAAPFSRAQAQDQSPTRSQPAAPRTERERAAPQPEAPDKKPSAQELRAGTRINATLESALDAQTAQPGDEVTARVTKDVKQDGQVVIHKGDRLLGHITAVEAGGAAGATSQLAVSFDRLLQGEARSELHTVVTAVFSTPSEDRARQEERMTREDPMMAPAPRRASSRPSSGSGGLLGGAGSTVNSTVGATTSTAGGVAGGAGVASRSAVGSATGAMLSTPVRAVRVESGAQAEHQSSLGSMFSTGEGQLRLESGTRLRFEVAARNESAPNKAGSSEPPQTKKK